MKPASFDISTGAYEHADPYLRPPRRMRKTLAIVACAWAALSLTGNVQAAEGGSGVYALGFISPQAGLMPEPGTYFGYNFYSYRGDSTTNVSVAGQVPVPGTGLKLPAQLTGSVKADVDSYAHLFQFTHVFEQKALGGQIGVGLTLPYVNADLDVSGNGVLTLTGPRGNTFAIPLSGRASASESGVGDLTLTGLLGWHQERMHYMAYLNVYAPTGSYDKNVAVNVGRNHWAIEPMAGVTYMNEKTGLELSGAAGITFNQRNSDTDYKSGDEFHLDLAAIQHFSEKFYLGLAGYTYRQLSADSGGGATSDYKGRVNGLGPIIGGVIPLGQKQAMFVNARYYYESSASNRLEGGTLFLTGAIKF